MKEYTYLPPNSMSLMALMAEIQNGSIKIPQFQRDFVWSKQMSAALLDSLLKGYPIGTFIFWRTKEELRALRNIGSQDLPKTRKGDYIDYVLDGQQRITSLFAAVKGLTIKRDEEFEEDFSSFHVDLQPDQDEPFVTTEMEENASKHRYITLRDQTRS